MLPIPHSPLAAGLIAFGLNLIRYLLIAGSAFLLFHRMTPQRAQARRLGSQPVSSEQAQREFLYSMLSMAIFALVGVAMYLLAQSGMSRIYHDDRYGPVWAVLSIPVMLILHDTWFYWTHRLMHWKPLFKHVHLLHHRSHDPSPLAAFAFHPLEALIEAGIAPLIALTLPVPRSSFFLFLTVSLLINVWGHLGFEMGPRGFMRSRLLAWLFNTTTHHHQHHQKTKWNFGLYFNVWDRLMGTNHPEYEATYEALTEGAQAEQDADASAQQVAVL
jgi:sterol desaturase/sphingolipid hydroxylase (fatty acid hydroxylase superfamily)